MPTLFVPRPWLPRVLLAVAASAVLCACASGGTRTDDRSSVLGKAAAEAPTHRIDTAVGRLAVYDSQADAGASAGAAALPTLVLWPSVYADSGIYAPWVERWRGRIRVIRIDGPGHGESGPGPVSGFSMKACAEAVKTVMDTLGISQATVGGTSWGGLVGGEFAIAFPQATQGVVMLNTPVFAEPGLSDRMIVLATRLIGQTEFFAGQLAKGFLLDATVQKNGPVVQSFFAHLARKPAGEMAAAVSAVLIDREALAPRMHRILAPTLFVTGKQDAMYPGDRLVQSARMVPNVRIAEVDARHLAVVDQPVAVGDLVEALVLER
jgi:3-oxoadipate enol-lactonase